MQLKVKRLVPEAELPRYAHPGDAGLDVFAAEDAVLQPGTSARIRTGFCVELPPNTEAQVRPRSGLAFRHGITVLNAPGTIDAGYRGEVAVLLINHGRDTFEITRGMRIAQLVIQPVIRAEVVETSRLGETVRGEGGFGSTGVHAGRVSV